MCVLFPKTNIWFQTSVLLNHVCIFPQRSVFCCFYFVPAVVIRCPGSFTNLIRCKDVGLLNGTPRIFFFLHGSFCMKKEKKRSLFYTQIRCKKEKKKSSSKKLVFHYPLTQRNLSFAIIVICSTFVNTMFLINVHRHECQYNCKRF